MPLQPLDFEVPYQRGPLRNRVGMSDNEHPGVKTAGETTAQMADGFTLKKGTGPNRSKMDCGSPDLHAAKPTGVPDNLSLNLNQTSSPQSNTAARTNRMKGRG